MSNAETPKTPAKRPARKKAGPSIPAAAVTEVIAAFEEQAERIAGQAQEFQEAWVDSVAAENVVFKRRNRTLVRFAAVICSLVVILVMGLGYTLYRSVYQTGPLLNRMDSAVSGIQANQKGIDSLVAFVEDVKAQQTQGSGQGDAVAQLIRLLCTSSDKVRQAACRALHYPSVDPAVPSAP